MQAWIFDDCLVEYGVAFSDFPTKKKNRSVFFFFFLIFACWLNKPILVVVKSRLWHYLLEALYKIHSMEILIQCPESVWREEKHVTKAEHPPMP
jgi:hypothetical protein